MRLMDKDAFLEKMKRTNRYFDVKFDIEEMPTIDAVPVVLCKDCKLWHEETGFCEKHSFFIDSDGVCCSPAESPNWTMTDPNDFCSYGERKDGEG